jgi:hypothetical protein
MGTLSRRIVVQIADQAPDLGDGSFPWSPPFREIVQEGSVPCPGWCGFFSYSWQSIPEFLKTVTEGISEDLNPITLHP